MPGRMALLQRKGPLAGVEVPTGKRRDGRVLFGKETVVQLSCLGLEVAGDDVTA